MKNSPKAFVAPLLIVITVLVIGGGIYFYSKSDRSSDYVNESLQHTYKVLVNKTEWNNKLIQSNNPENWDISSKNTVIRIVDTQDNFYCGDKKANFIKYSKHSSGSNSVGGDWNTISVVDCGTYYFVYEFSDSGPKLYGPFELDSKVSTLNQVQQTNTRNPKTQTSPAISTGVPNAKINIAKAFLEQMKKELGLNSEMLSGVVEYKNLVGYKVSFSKTLSNQVSQYLNSKLTNMSNDARFVTERSIGYKGNGILCFNVGLGAGSASTDMPYVWGTVE